MLVRYRLLHFYLIYALVLVNFEIVQRLNIIPLLSRTTSIITVLYENRRMNS